METITVKGHEPFVVVYLRRDGLGEISDKSEEGLKRIVDDVEEKTGLKCVVMGSDVDRLEVAG